MIRDIPSTHVVEGNRRTSLRQDAQKELRLRGERCECIRCREVRGDPVDPGDVRLDSLVYEANGAQEHFLSFVTPGDQIAGYLRLSLPGTASPRTNLPDLAGAALIREVHVYGQSLPLGRARDGAAQHAGLGTRLTEQAEALARERGFKRMAVIAALGTRGYYRKLGYELAETYMVKAL